MAATETILGSVGCQFTWRESGYLGDSAKLLSVAIIVTAVVRGE